MGFGTYLTGVTKFQKSQEQKRLSVTEIFLIEHS